MKGFLTAHDCIFRKTHDLDELGRACEAIDPSMAPILTTARTLTIFAWEFRYPGAAEIPSIEEAQTALATARSAYQTLLATLPPAVQP